MARAPLTFEQSRVRGVKPLTRSVLVSCQPLSPCVFYSSSVLDLKPK